MRKTLIVLLLLIQYANVLAGPIRPEIINFNQNLFYHVKGENNSRLLIFLHGGVSNPAFNKGAKVPDLNFILENNQYFIQSALDNKFDVLIPIKNDSLNWLENHRYCFRTIKNYLDSTATKYNSCIVSGFSDGGAGSYKLFYEHVDYFTGLLVFNGYPQHKNHNTKVDYSKTVSRKVVFSSTFNDKVIPYEFALAEYCKQKVSNPDTYIYITKGAHSFKEYTENDFICLFDMITLLPDNTETKAIQAYIRRDKVIKFYKFRAKIYRKFNYGKEILEESKRQKKLYRR